MPNIISLVIGVIIGLGLAEVGVNLIQAKDFVLGIYSQLVG